MATKKEVRELKAALTERTSDGKNVKLADLELALNEWLSSNQGVEHSGKMFETDLYINHGSAYCELLCMLCADYKRDLTAMPAYKESISKLSRPYPGFESWERNQILDCMSQAKQDGFIRFYDKCGKIVKFFESCGFLVFEDRREKYIYNIEG